MAYNTTLKYQRFDQILDSVLVDYQTLILDQAIEPQQLIKVAQRVSANLGMKIQMTKEVILEVEKGQVRLPFDFSIANYGMACGEFSVTVVPPQGTNIQEVPFPTYQGFNTNPDSCSDGIICSKCNLTKPSCSCGKKSCPPVTIPNYNPLVPYGDYCVKPRVFMNCKGQGYELIQIVNTEVRTYSYTMPIKFRHNKQMISCECPNLFVKSINEVSLDKGWLYANFDCGKIYLNYQGALEDEDGNLLVPDHPTLNEYYEYALKERILENLVIDGEDFERRLADVRFKLKMAQNEATLLVAMPDFNVIKKTWEVNRKAQYFKYYRMFESFGCEFLPHPHRHLSHGRR